MDDKQFSSDHSEQLEDVTGFRVKVICFNYSLFTTALYYSTSRLVNKDQTYNGRISQRSSKIQERFQVQISEHVFGALDQLSILSFLKMSKTTCISKSISEGVTMLLVHSFIEKLSNAALYPLLQLQSSRSSKLN